MRLTYRGKAKWSRILKVVGGLEVSLVFGLYLYTHVFKGLSALGPILGSPKSLVTYLVISLLWVVALIAFTKHRAKNYGLALSLWVGIVVVLVALSTIFTNSTGNSSNTSSTEESLLPGSIGLLLLLLISSPVIYNAAKTWKGYLASVLVYLFLVLPTFTFLTVTYLGENFQDYVSGLTHGGLGSIQSLFSPMTSSKQGQFWLTLAALSLISFIMMSYYSPRDKPYMSLRSVGLTYPAIPVLSSILAFVLVYEDQVNLYTTPLLVTAAVSLVSIPLSLVPALKAKSVLLGLSISTASLISSALVFLFSLTLSPSLTPSPTLAATSLALVATSLVVAGAGASVIPRGLTDPDKVKAKLSEALRAKHYSMAKRYISFLNTVGVTPTEVACQLSRQGDCSALMWIVKNYKVQYESCQDLVGFADCIMRGDELPSDVGTLLEVLAKRDSVYKERLAGLVLVKSGDERTRDIAKKVLSVPVPSPAPVREDLNLPPLTQWDPNLWVGREIYGYQVKSVLGKGGTAYVLMAERDSKRFAVKVPFVSPPGSSERTRMSSLAFTDMAGESSKLQEISSKTEDMVNLYGVFVDKVAIKEIMSGKTLVYLKSPPAMVMELMEGGDAEGLLKEQAVFYSEKWEKVVAYILWRVSRALSIVHSEGYVHLDVKTKNVFFTSPPGRSGEEVLNNLLSGKVKVKLGDLGASRRVGSTFDQYTPEYCPVDQVQAMLLRKGASPSMDIYALGATGYKLLTSSPLNPQEVVELMDVAVERFMNRGNYSEPLDRAFKVYREFYSNIYVSNVSQDLLRVIKAMVDPDPERRPRADQVERELERLLASSK
ncbi:protein kinase [Metallosphaera tengchongensis]|uniref:Protein kinase n=1 Tax=Metallosphaera tengchongensis TaxID=1532350 RepID=A0A6N0NRD3_9CREN|nr:protein kinase [Metallosphaera tengchongensis]QKQ99433.1 protein kinase [Metallosphaera tengchongensis]